MKARACIFDMNGVIIDDERFHKESWKIFCKKHECAFREEEFAKKFQGRTNKEILQYLMPGISKEERTRLMHERLDVVRSMYKSNVPGAEGLLEFLRTIRKAELKTAVATSSPRYYTDYVLEALSLTDLFHEVVTAEEVTHGKPDPEIYELAAKRISVEPKDCLVFEDSISGITAAKAAGMKVVAITTTRRKDELLGADYVIDGFKQLTIATLEKAGF